MFYIDRNLGDISNINKEESDEEIITEEKDVFITNNDAGREIEVKPELGDALSLVNIHCNFTNSIVTSGVELPYQGKLEEVFNYSVSDYNGMNGNNVIAGFNNVRYKMKYPDNDNTTIFTVDEGDNTFKKYLKVSLSEDDKTNKYIGIHDDILIPLDTTYSKEGNFITDAAKEAATAVGKQVWKIVATKAVQAIPYVGSIIAGLISGGGTIVRQAAQIVWDHGRNLLPGPDENINVRSVKLYKNNEVPVMDRQTRSVDLVRQDDPNVPGDDNIVDDEEEPIWAGSTEATFDILEELEYTMTENNDTFIFDIDQYNSDPVVAAAPEGSPRPIGMKRVVIHTNISSVIPKMDSQNPVLIENNGTYGIQYDDSSNELSIISVNQNRSVSNVGTFDVDVPSLGELTVTPQSFPYTFRISDYNSGYSTNYVGIRNLTIDYEPASSLPVVINKIALNNTEYNTYDFTLLTSSVTIALYNEDLIVVDESVSGYTIKFYVVYGGTSNIGINYSSLVTTRYFRCNALQNYSKVSFKSNNQGLFQLTDSNVNDRVPVEMFLNKYMCKFNWVAP